MREGWLEGGRQGEGFRASEKRSWPKRELEGGEGVVELERPEGLPEGVVGGGTERGYLSRAR